MRVVSVTPGLVGKQLGKTIFTNSGRVLLAKGTVLTPAYINGLLRHGHRSVYILNELVPEIEVDDIINEETRQRAVREVKKLMQKTIRGQVTKLDLVPIIGLVEQMMAEIDGNSDVIFGMSVLRTVDNYTFVHSVNVATLSLLIGSAFKYVRDDLRTLGIGAILHDLGKIATPLEILNKPGPLTEAEMTVMREHAKAGFDILRERLDISLFSAHVALQHHERLDGSGYPRGLGGADIHEYGRIAAVADVYDAITSDRVYRQRLDPLPASEILIKGKKSLFDPRIVDCLLSKLAIYPNGTIVVLKNGSLAIVSGQNPDDLHHPTVVVVSDENHQPVNWFTLPTTAAEPIRLILTEWPSGFVQTWRQQKSQGTG